MNVVTSPVLVDRMASADLCLPSKVPARRAEGGSVGHTSEVMEHEGRALAARLGLPHTGFLLERLRLRAAAGPVRKGGVLSLVAGPGCGKTAFIMDLLSTAKGPRFYLALDEADRDPVRFVKYLGASFGVGRSGVGRSDTALSAVDRPDVDSSDERLVELMEGMVEALGQHQAEQSLLAIDDIHNVESSPSIVLALDLLVRGLAPGWTVVLASRRRLPVKLDGLTLGGRLVKLDGRNLRLTPSEIGAWVAKNWDVALEPVDTRALWRLTHGWPAALVLLGQRLVSSGRPVSRGDVARVIAQGRDLRAYLERHVVEELDERSAQIMLVAGLLPRVTLPRDAEIFAQDQGTVESVLEELVSKGLMVARCGRQSYIVHPLVRGFAESELLKREGGVELVARAAAHLEQIEEHYHAARLYLRGGRLVDASRPLRALALSSLDAAASFAREEWSSLLPANEASLADGGPWFLVCSAHALQQRGSHKEASQLYEQATRVLSADGDREGLLLTLLSSVFSLHMQSRWEECLAVLKRSHTVARTPEEKAEVLVVQGQIMISLCRWDEAVESWEKALVMVPEERRSTLLHRIHLGRAKLFHAMGHYSLAKQWVERAVEVSAGTSKIRCAMALHGASMLACLGGDYTGAERLGAESRRLAEAHGLSFMGVPALLSEADLARGRWDYRTAVAKCREAQGLAVKLDDAECAYWAEQMLGDICRCNRNSERALEHHRNALKSAQTKGLSVSETTCSRAAQGMDLVLLGREKEARGVLEETIRVSRQWGLKASLVPSLLYLGWIHAKDGREHEASCCLGEAMRTAEEHEHVHFLSQEARVAVPIFALCDRFGVGGFLRSRVVPTLPARMQDYFCALAEGEVYPTDLPLGVSRRTSVPVSLVCPGDQEVVQAGGKSVAARISLLTDREREILSAIAGGMPNKVIGARLFISEKTVKTHANHIFQKLEVSSRLQATLMFQSHQRAVAAGTALRNRKR